MQIHFENPGAGMARSTGGPIPVVPPGPPAQTGAGFVALLAGEGVTVAEPPVLTHPLVLPEPAPAGGDQSAPVAGLPADPVPTDGTAAVPVPPPMPVWHGQRQIRSLPAETVSVPAFLEGSGEPELPQEGGERPAGRTEDARVHPDQDPAALETDTAEATQPAPTSGPAPVLTAALPSATGGKVGGDPSLPPTPGLVPPIAAGAGTFAPDVKPLNRTAREGEGEGEAARRPTKGKAIELAAPGPADDRADDTVEDRARDTGKGPQIVSDTAVRAENLLRVPGNAFALTAAPPTGLSLPSATVSPVPLLPPFGPDMPVVGRGDRPGDVIAPSPITAAPGMDAIAMVLAEGNPPNPVRFASSPTPRADEVPQGTGAAPAPPANPVATGSPVPQAPLSPSGQAPRQGNPHHENPAALAIAADAAPAQPEFIAQDVPDPAGGAPLTPATAALGTSMAPVRADAVPLPGPHEPRAVPFDDLPRMMPVLLKAQGAAGAVEMRLQPADLGAISISLQPEADRVTVVIQADRPETADLLRRNADLLSQELRQGGFAQASISFAAGGQGGWGTGGQPEGQRTDHGDAGRDGHGAPAPHSSDRAARAMADPVLAGQGRLYLRL